jgi:Soluble lytic murein transglycosylase and related regulatory proteins (some contain LysM/invasin domains)
VECNGYSRFEGVSLYDHLHAAEDRQQITCSSRRQRRIERQRKARTRKALAFLILMCIGVTAATTAAVTVTPDSKTADKPTVAAINAPATQASDSAYVAEPAAVEIHAETVFKALNVPMDAELQSGINDLCQKYGAPFELIMAIMDNESDFIQNAVSDDGHDYGLMQIRDVNQPQLTADLGVTDFLDPLQNAECGIYMISGYIKKYGDLNLALMAYNCGETGARRLWDKGTYSTEYSRGIIRQMDEFTAEREG